MTSNANTDNSATNPATNTAVDSAATQPKVLRSVTGRSGHLRLNRPKALNSLDHDMVVDITAALTDWLTDDSVDHVLVTSDHPKAFCAGGDVRSVRDSVLSGDSSDGERFFRDEYVMNALIAEFAQAKPYVAVINGIAMGGGLGVSLHGSHRVVTEKASCSMPEMAIGFVPDVGITYFSQHVDTALGGPSPAIARFTGLTGYRLTAADMLWAGWATHFVPSASLADFLAVADSDGVEAALEKYSLEPDSAEAIELIGRPQLAEWHGCISACFGADTWAEIDRALTEAGSSGACEEEDIERFRALMEAASPESLVAAVELYAANAEPGVGLRKALDNELRLGEYLRHRPNFAEGVRAVLIDKDRNAKFEPARTEDVDVEAIRATLR
nr:enoyl-CoA hydratase/isomerase family protein [Corynebacterium lactis]